MSSFRQYQFAGTCGSKCINHAFMLDEHAVAVVEEILAPDRHLELAYIGFEGCVARRVLGRSVKIFHLDTNANENGSY